MTGGVVVATAVVEVDVVVGGGGGGGGGTAAMASTGPSGNLVNCSTWPLLTTARTIGVGGSKFTPNARPPAT